MIVDDDLMLLTELGEGLVANGHRALLAPEPDLALLIASYEKIDIAFIDLVLPGIDGLELTRQLRQIHPDLPVVVITSGAPGWTLARAREMKVAAFLIKPFKARVIVDATAILIKRFGDVSVPNYVPVHHQKA